MGVIDAVPEPRLTRTLGVGSFADAYAVTCSAPALDARSAAQAIFNTPPNWVRALMRTRNAIVRPFGLKTGLPPPVKLAGGQIRMFPVLAESPHEILMGLDDRHLDFRLAVGVLRSGTATKVTVTTVVHTHNLPGRVYLAAILPFHRVIVRSMLSAAASAWH